VGNINKVALWTWVLVMPGWSPLQGVHGKGMTFCNGYREREGRLKIETSHVVMLCFLFF